MNQNHPLINASFLHESARDSVRFALSCLEPHGKNLRATSTFVKPDGEIMHWHDFGDLEGPGWAANAVGGAHLLHRWGGYVGDQKIQESALRLLNHVLEDGFIEEGTGFIWPYFDLSKQRFCLNYRHDNDWLCPGSLAKIGVQLLEFAADLPGGDLPRVMEQTALRLAEWLQQRTPLLETGWVPRRITLDGKAYPLSPDGRPDSIFEDSADGLFYLQLLAMLTTRGLADYSTQAAALGNAFISSGGLWGSINHDTYDHHENVAYSVAFRVFRQASGWLGQPGWRAFAFEKALPSLQRFRMAEDRNGVATRGLLWMEESWDTSYLWENAEAAHAYLEAWKDTGSDPYLQAGTEILQAIALHHHGAGGFLTEGVDWNNHVGQQHHFDGALFGDIQYTEPLLNNLHLVGPTLFLFEQR